MSVHPCRITCGPRLATFSVGKVLFGFSPGDSVKLAYDSGSPPELFSSKSDLLVFAVNNGIWRGLGSLLQTPSPENIRVAHTIATSWRYGTIRSFETHHTDRAKIVFVGTVTGLWPERNHVLPCKETMLFPVTYKVNSLLAGSWPNPEIRVVFPDCFGPPDPPIRIGNKMIVLASTGREGKPVVYLRDVLPPSNLAQARAYFSGAMQEGAEQQGNPSSR
jgi:hypothetical protein